MSRSAQQLEGNTGRIKRGKEGETGDIPLKTPPQLLAPKRGEGNRRERKLLGERKGEPERFSFGMTLLSVSVAEGPGGFENFARACKLFGGWF